MSNKWKFGIDDDIKLGEKKYFPNKLSHDFFGIEIFLR